MVQPLALQLEVNSRMYRSKGDEQRLSVQYHNPKRRGFLAGSNTDWQGAPTKSEQHQNIDLFVKIRSSYYFMRL